MNDSNGGARQRRLKKRRTHRKPWNVVRVCFVVAAIGCLSLAGGTVWSQSVAFSDQYDLDGDPHTRPCSQGWSRVTQDRVAVSAPTHAGLVVLVLAVAGLIATRVALWRSILCGVMVITTLVVSACQPPLFEEAGRDLERRLNVSRYPGQTQPFNAYSLHSLMRTSYGRPPPWRGRYLHLIHPGYPALVVLLMAMATLLFVARGVERIATDKRKAMSVAAMITVLVAAFLAGAGGFTADPGLQFLIVVVVALAQATAAVALCLAAYALRGMVPTPAMGRARKPKRRRKRARPD